MVTADAHCCAALQAIRTQLDEKAQARAIGAKNAIAEGKPRS
jgi:hypothetical protein